MICELINIHPAYAHSEFLPVTQCWRGRFTRYC